MGLKKNKKKIGVSLAALREKNTASERMKRTMVCMSYEYININYEFIRKMYLMIESICDPIIFHLQRTNASETSIQTTKSEPMAGSISCRNGLKVGVTFDYRLY